MICGNAGPQHRDDDDQHDKVGEAHPRVHHALDGEVERRAEIAADDAD
jgi:hypothetical protein